MPTPRFPAPYLCYMHRDGGGVPYFEVLPECSRAGAELYAARLLREHVDCASVDLWRDEKLMFSLSRADLVRREAQRNAA